MAESIQERTIRYLNDAWALEKSLVPGLEAMANKADDPVIKALFQEHSAVTHQQEEMLEDRIRALGGELNRAKSFMDQMMNMASDFMNIFHDEKDQTTQELMKAFATENFEMAMYQSLEAFATAVGDSVTAQLARTISQQEKETADRIWAQIGPAASRAVQNTERVPANT